MPQPQQLTYLQPDLGLSHQPASGYCRSTPSNRACFASIPQPHPLQSLPFRCDAFSPNAAAQSRYGESDTRQSYMLILNLGYPLAFTAELLSG